MTDNDKMLIHIPKDRDYIEILGYRIDGFDSFEAFCEHLKKFSDMEDTINRQKAKIEEQKGEIDRLNYILQCYALEYGTAADKERFLKPVIAEAVKEFAEWLKVKAPTVNFFWGKDVDKLVKEFTEGESNGMA